MRRTRVPATGRAHDDVDGALACLSADQLRVLVREMLLELDDVAHGRIVDSLIARAGHADPGDVDEHQRRGSGAFLRRDYAAAHRIFGALLGPIGEGEIDLGQHELADEVLGVDLCECAAQYVVSAYMVSEPAQRAGAVRAAIGEVDAVGTFWEPIREMERVAMEPLPLLEDFLPVWRALLEQEAGRERRSDWDADGDWWLREVVWRMEGASGLAKLARSTRRAADVRAWCQKLVDAGDWKAALSAFEKRRRGHYRHAAQLVASCQACDPSPVAVWRWDGRWPRNWPQLSTHPSPRGSRQVRKGPRGTTRKILTRYSLVAADTLWYPLVSDGRPKAQNHQNRHGVQGVAGSNPAVPTT